MSVCVVHMCGQVAGQWACVAAGVNRPKCPCRPRQPGAATQALPASGSRSGKCVMTAATALAAARRTFQLVSSSSLHSSSLALQGKWGAGAGVGEFQVEGLE